MDRSFLYAFSLPADDLSPRKPDLHARIYQHRKKRLRVRIDMGRNSKRALAPGKLSILLYFPCQPVTGFEIAEEIGSYDRSL